MTKDDIKAYRTRKGMTQTELGNLCGVGKSSVSHWESGVTEPSGSAKMILEELLNGDRMIIPLTPLEERLLNQLQKRRGHSTREELIKALVLEDLSKED